MKAIKDQYDVKGSTDSGRKPSSPLLLLVLALASIGTSVFLWFEIPEHRAMACPALAAAGSIFLLLSAWYGGMRVARLKQADTRVDGLEQTSAPILITNAEGQTTYMNHAATTLFKDFQIDTTAKRALDALGLSASPDESAGFARLSGKVVRWRTRTLSVSSGRVWQLDDVTEIIKGHAELQREMTVLQDIFDLMPVGFLSADSDGRIDRCNGTLAGWLGETPRSLIGRSLGEFITEGKDSGELGGVSMGVVTLQRHGGGEPFLATLMQTAKMNKDGQ